MQRERLNNQSFKGGTVKARLTSCQKNILTSLGLILKKHCNGQRLISDNCFLKGIVCNVIMDLLALTSKDPAARGNINYVFATYSSFKAILYYRLATAIHYYHAQDNHDMFRYMARSISEDAKEKTQIEIHPAANIGKNFVIDHGVGTVIGETCTIGANCYILQGVILGATGIADNKNGKRHPTIGNSVEIGGFTKILGPVSVGDNVKISANSIITQDIPSNSKVVICNQLQLNKNISDINIYGLFPFTENLLCMRGVNLGSIEVRLTDDTNSKIRYAQTRVVERTSDMIVFTIDFRPDSERNATAGLNIALEKNKKNVAILINSLALNHFIGNSNVNCKQAKMEVAK